MKKNLLTLLLSVSLLTISFTGCSSDGTTDNEDKRIESVEEDTTDKAKEESKDAVSTATTESTDPQPGTSVTGEGIIVEGPGEDDGIIVVEGEVTEIVEGEVTEIIEETESDTTTESSEAVEEDTSAGATDDTDWSTAYADYFTRDDIMPATLKISATATGDGMTFEMVVAMVEDTAFMSYDFGTVAADMYVTADKAYVRTEMEGQEAWSFAPITSEEEAGEMTAGVADNTTLIDNENIASVTYREAIEEDGIIYDVLDVEVADDSGIPGTAAYFINRETQQIAKCVMERDGATAVCLVEEIESIELPAEAETATEVPMEDILGALVGVLFMGAGATME